MSKIQLTTLDNGLRVMTDHVDGVHSVALGLWAGVGTRNEDLINNGAAHMVEHMLFKGTDKRNAQDIVESIENVGGHMNAYTSREVTSYHIHLLADDAPLALSVLADMYQNHTMPDDEVERERQVILQEIGMCNDTPDDLVFDHVYETAFPGQALGAPILGAVPCVQNMKRDALMGYARDHYTPANTVVSAAGHIDHDAFVAQVEQEMNAMPADQKTEKIPANYKGGDHRAVKDLEQSHVVLGFQGIARLDDEYYAAQALSSILGGGMSSRLFQEIREKRGLVYSIYSFHSAYADDGLFGIYAGTSPSSLDELVPVVCDEVMKIADDVSAEELARAKAQLKSYLLMGRESMMTRADQNAKYVLQRDSVFDVEQLVRNIDGIDLGSISSAARRVFSTAPTIAGLGPLEKLDGYDNIARRLAA